MRWLPRAVFFAFFLSLSFALGCGGSGQKNGVSSPELPAEPPRLPASPPKETGTTSKTTEEGLLVRFDFEDGARDASQNELHGDLIGNAEIGEKGIGKALYLDGEDDELRVAAPSDESLFPGEAITVSFFLNLESLPDGIADLTHHIGTVAGGARRSKVFFRTNAANQLFFAVTTSEGIQYLRSPPLFRLRAGRWIHLAGTYDGVSQNIYINGKLKSSVPNSGSIDWGEEKDRHFFAIAGFFGGSTTRVRGYMDEVKVYNRALSADEIAAESAKLIVPTGNLSDLLVHLDFEAGETDLSGWENDGWLYGSAKIEEEGGVSALYLDGENGGLQFEPVPGLFPTDALAFSFWVKWDEEPPIHTEGTWKGWGIADLVQIISGGQSRAYLQLKKREETGKVTLMFVVTVEPGKGTVKDGRAVTLTMDLPSPTAGEWHHVVGNFDGREVVLYMDNQRGWSAVRRAEGLLVWPELEAGGKFRLGGQTGGASGNLKGFIDDFRFYKKALTTDEIQELFDEKKF